MDHNPRIESALADLDTQEKPNYRATAKKYGVARTTLSERYKGKSTSRRVATSEYCQHLTIEQEEVLIDQINRLMDCIIPLTTRIIRNIVEEIIRESIGKNWTTNFIKYYQDQFKNLYLYNIVSGVFRTEWEGRPDRSSQPEIVTTQLGPR